jgi:hypothetical protein
MARGYQEEDIKEKLVKVLSSSKTGLSGVEISEKLGLNRVTMTKYLKIFAAEGLIREKNIGNVTLWFVDEGIEQFQFPDDYFKVKNRLLEFLTEGSERQSYALIRNCVHSDAKASKIMTEIIVPAIDSIHDLFEKGKISKSEEKLHCGIISKSIQILNLMGIEVEPKKNVTVLAADSKSSLYAEAATASFHSDGWRTFSLGDMSDSIDVLFDLDLQKFLGKVWKRKEGIMIIVIFSDSEEGMKFFAEAVNSIKGKFGKNLHLVLCSKIKKTTAKAELVSENLEDVLQWSQTIYEKSFA